MRAHARGAPWHESLIFVEASLLRPVDRLASRLLRGLAEGNLLADDTAQTAAAAIKGGNIMSATIINLIIQIIAGAIGGNAAGAGMEKANSGTAGNTIAGALGGLGGGQILSALIPALAGSAGAVST